MLGKQMAANEPVQPGAPRGVTKGADKSGAAAAVRDKLRTRERQSTFVAGSLAMRIEKDAPGRIHCIKVATTKHKTVTTIVFDRGRRVRAPALADDDDYDSDDDGEGEELKGSEPVPHIKAAAGVAQQPASSTKATTETSAGGGQQAKSGAWQQPRKPAKRQPLPAAKPDAKQVTKVSRNSLSATSGEQRPAEAIAPPPALEAKQLAAMVNSVNQISKEVCPQNAFTIKRSVPVDGVQVEIHLTPLCPAAEMARQNPTYLGERLKDCYLRSDGHTVREMLTPGEPTPFSSKSSVKKFWKPQVLPRPKSPTASPPPLVEGMAGEVEMGEHPGPSN